ncbi:MAG: hypothetical protein V1875_03800 [Candidatus Altiarchaeota archaeon]
MTAISPITIALPLFLGIFILTVAVISNRKGEKAFGIDQRTMWDFGAFLALVGYISGVYIVLAVPGSAIAVFGLAGKKNWPQTAEFRKATLGYLVGVFLILVGLALYGGFTFSMGR